MNDGMVECKCSLFEPVQTHEIESANIRLCLSIIILVSCNNLPQRQMCAFKACTLHNSIATIVKQFLEAWIESQLCASMSVTHDLAFILQFTNKTSILAGENNLKTLNNRLPVSRYYQQCLLATYTELNDKVTNGKTPKLSFSVCYIRQRTCRVPWLASIFIQEE
jgi:hypothetical protein